MLISLFTGALALTMAKPVEAKVIAVSMFKNGYAVVTREIPVSKAGDYTINQIPQASLGTLWFGATGGARLEGVETTHTDKPVQRPVDSLDAILQANVNKTLTVTYLGENGKLQTDTGKVLSAAGTLLVLQTDSSTVVINRSTVTKINAANGSLAYTTEQTDTEHGLRFKVAGNGGTIQMLSLERGIAWAPGYSLDLSDKKQLTLTAKATVLNDLENLTDVDAKFVTGFPNVPFANLKDPLVSGESLEQFVASLNSIGSPFEKVAMRQEGLLSQNSGYVRDAAVVPIEPSGTGTALEDLFFYNQPKLTLQKGERAYYVILRSSMPYEDVYTWELGDPLLTGGLTRSMMPNYLPNEVWHAIEFRNTSGQPLTTGTATTSKQGEVIGQDTLTYVPNGGLAQVKITKALDIKPETIDQEVSRERGAIKDKDGHDRYDLVTLKCTLMVQNNKNEAVKVCITRPYTGDLVSAEGNPKNTPTIKGLRSINAGGTLEWKTTAEPGKKLLLSFTYKAYLATQ